MQLPCAQTKKVQNEKADNDGLFAYKRTMQ